MGYVRLRSKYSAEQKKVAVEHYLNHGRCLAATLKALGYPCRETLATWIDELRPETGIRVVGKAGGVMWPLMRDGCTWLASLTCTATSWWAGEHATAYADQPGQGRIGDGVVPPATGSRADLSQRPQ